MIDVERMQDEIDALYSRDLPYGASSEQYEARERKEAEIRARYQAEGAAREQNERQAEYDRILRAKNLEYQAEREVRDLYRAAEPVDPNKLTTSLFVSRLLDSSGLDGIPDAVPVIDGILFEDSANALIGSPGCGKSFVALDMAGSIGTGITWQGREVAQGRVLYLVAEGARGVRKRVRAWESHHGRTMANVYFYPHAIQATEADDWAVLVAGVTAMKPRMIILDTLARHTVGMDENTAKDMGVFINRVEQLREATESCVLTVHHSGKNKEAGGRGSSALYGAWTTEITVSRTKDVITVKNSKQKDDEEFEDITLTMKPVTDSVALVQSAASGWTDEDHDRDNASKILHLMRSLGASGISRTDLRGMCKDRLDIQKSSFDYAFTKVLIEKGLVTSQSKRGTEYWTAKPIS